VDLPEMAILVLHMEPYPTGSVKKMSVIPDKLAINPKSKLPKKGKLLI
jgi:hypothetical protein